MHELDDFDFEIEVFEELSSVWEESGKLSQIKASDSLHSIIGVLQQVNENLNKVKVLLLVEVNEVLLPELLSVDGAPSQGLLVHFFSELVN